MTKKTFILFSIVLIANTIFAQRINISGKVIAQANQKPLEFATVALYSQSTQKVIDGTTTLEDGSFALSTKTKTFYIEIGFMGFETKKIQNFTIKNNQVNLGSIVLKENSHTLNDVVVRAEKSSTEFKLDKRVFNVGKDLSSTGASALEVLDNVPSVAVNIEGQVSLRGSTGVQMLINGKPSILASEEGNALGTITADMIEKIEVVTNPSAKYNAEGTSGIINIILKKNEKKGLNGSITLNTGFPNNHSLGLSLNNRTEKFNLFSQIGIGYRTFPSENENINKDFIHDTEIKSKGKADKNEQFYNVVLGADYHINPLNVISLSGNFAYEIETENAETKFDQFQTYIPINTWNRLEKTKGTNPKWQYELQYKSQFKDNKEHSLTLSTTGNFFGKNKKSGFENQSALNTNLNQQQQSTTNFKEAQFTQQIDYTKPFFKKYKLELGAQHDLNNISNQYQVSKLNNGTWVENQNLSNTFNYNQGVLGIYSTLSYENKKWGVKAGVRVENTTLKTELKNTNEINKRNYTDWFPSLHTSYKFTDKFSMQAGYSRRIFRPRLWDLNPFFNLRNNYSIYTGNPHLTPEYSHAFEISSLYSVEKGSLNLSIYHRFTSDIIETITSFENNTSTTRPQNIGTNAGTGFELNGKYSISQWLSVRGNFNYNYYERKGSFDKQKFDFIGKRWTARFTAKMKLPAKFDVELSSNYNSKYKEFQAEIAESWYVNLGVRKKILKGRGVINLSIRDIFASRTRENISFAFNEFYTYNKRQRGRFFTIGFSYGFGKGEAMEFSGHKRF